MSFETLVAFRYLTGRRKRLKTFITTGIAIAGVTLGVGTLIVTLAVMNGFHTEIQKRILGLQSHIVVGSNSKSGIENYNEVSSQIENLDEVIASAPFVYSQAVLRGASGASTGAVIKGIIYNKERNIANIDEYLLQGSWQEFSNEKKAIVLGKALSKTINVTVGEKLFLVSLTSPDESSMITSLLTPIPKVETLTVCGIFDSGMYEYDSSLCYISLQTAQEIFQLKNAVTGISIKVKNFNKAGKIAKKLQTILGNKYWVQSWQVMNKSLFSALKLEKIMMFIVVTLIVIVAAFNIISNLLLFTVEKVRDIGILQAIGATKRDIQKIFLFEGLFIGIFGIVSGSGLGIVISLLVDKYKLVRLPPDVYYLDRIPLRMSIYDIVVIVLAAFVIVLISTIYPARKAAATNPLEAIRYG